MQAWQVSEWGLKELRQVELPEPVPGPGEVKVSFEAASLNYRDLLVVQGAYNPKFERPLIPCSDGFGRIVEVGPGVSSTLLKKSVLTTFCPQWESGPPNAEKLRQTMGGPNPGVLQQYRNFKPEELVVLEEPSALTPAEWSTIPCAGVTAWNCLRSSGLFAGQTLLLIGTGGVSLFGLQIAKMLGAKTLILSSVEEKRNRARELGADFVADYVEQPKWSDWVLEMTDGRGVDVVLETGGAGTLAQSLRSVKVGGHISLIGVLSGNQEPLNILPLVMKAVTVEGALVGNHQHQRELIEALTHSMVRPVVGEVFSWNDVPAAFDTLRRGSQFGNIVIEFNQTP